MKLKTFYEDQTNDLCTGAHKRNLVVKGLWTEHLVSGGVGTKADYLNKDLAL